MEVLRCRFLEHIPSEIQDFSIQNDFCLVLFNDSKLHLYKISSWTLFLVIPGTKDLALRKVIWHSSEQFVAVGMSGALLLWNISDLIPLETTRVHGSGIWDIAKSEDDYALAGDDGILRLYELDEDHF